MVRPNTKSLQTKQLTYQGDRPGSVFSCVEQDASSTMWPEFLDAWLVSRSPALGTQLIGVATPDGTAMARIRGFWLTFDGRWDPSNSRMPSLVLPAARALALLRARAFSSELIIELYGEGYGSPRFEDLRALLTAFRAEDPNCLPVDGSVDAAPSTKNEELPLARQCIDADSALGGRARTREILDEAFCAGAYFGKSNPTYNVGQLNHAAGERVTEILNRPTENSDVRECFRPPSAWAEISQSWWKP